METKGFSQLCSDFFFQIVSLLTQRKMNGNKLKPKSPNLNHFLCQPDPIGPKIGLNPKYIASDKDLPVMSVLKCQMN